MGFILLPHKSIAFQENYRYFPDKGMEIVPCAQRLVWEDLTEKEKWSDKASVFPPGVFLLPNLRFQRRTLFTCCGMERVASKTSSP